MSQRKSRTLPAVVLAIVMTVFLIGCDAAGVTGEDDPLEYYDAPERIRTRALEIAESYLGMDYEYGGQDHHSTLSTLGIDCSGLIVNAYEEAVIGTPYALPFYDAAVVNFLNSYTRPIDSPEPGDLIFMGEDSITHIAIYERHEGEDLVFIDAFSTAEEVQRRSYPEDHYKVKSFGRLRVVSRYYRARKQGRTEWDY